MSVAVRMKNSSQTIHNTIELGDYLRAQSSSFAPLRIFFPSEGFYRMSGARQSDGMMRGRLVQVNAHNLYRWEMFPISTMKQNSSNGTSEERSLHSGTIWNMYTGLKRVMDQQRATLDWVNTLETLLSNSTLLKTVKNEVHQAMLERATEYSSRAEELQTALVALQERASLAPRVIGALRERDAALELMRLEESIVLTMSPGEQK
jgi:hypothetical protein